MDAIKARIVALERTKTKPGRDSKNNFFASSAATKAEKSPALENTPHP